MTDHLDTDLDDDGPERHEADGMAYRLRCGGCNETFEVMDEDPRSSTVSCDLCGHTAKVTGDF